MAKSRSHPGWIVAFWAYFALILSIIAIADLGKLPVDLLDRIPHYDTWGHFILYGIASFLSHRAMNRRAIARFGISLPLAPLIFTGFTILEELLQQILPHRTYSLVDLVASLGGIVIFYWLGERCHRH